MKTKEKKASESQAVDAYLKALKHPLAALAQSLRRAILAADKSIGEEIKWNAPAFFYTGALAPFDPKEYKRHLVVFNFFRKDCIRLVFWRGDVAQDESGLLEGDYPDGRRLAHFSSVKELTARKKALAAVLKAQLRRVRR
jgi:hypothetical protein